MRLKKDVSLDGLHVSMRSVIPLVENICHKHGKESVITSGTEGFIGDGVHSLGSYHYYGMALDYRTRFFSDGMALDVAAEIRNKLGRKYAVVFEGTHIHIQYNWGKF